MAILYRGENLVWVMDQGVYYKIAKFFPKDEDAFFFHNDAQIMVVIGEGDPEWRIVFHPNYTGPTLRALLKEARRFGTPVPSATIKRDGSGRLPYTQNDDPAVDLAKALVAAWQRLAFYALARAASEDAMFNVASLEATDWRQAGVAAFARHQADTPAIREAIRAMLNDEE